MKVQKWWRSLLHPSSGEVAVAAGIIEPSESSNNKT